MTTATADRTAQRDSICATLCVCAAWILSCDTAYSGDLPVTISVVPNNKVSLQAFGQPLSTQSSAVSINQAIEGTESSQCQPYGRTSSATGRSSVDVSKHDDKWYTLTLNAESYARGGHYRTCSGCFANQCVGIYGNDTTGSATSSASAVVTIAFDPEFQHPGDYSLAVSSTGQSPTITLTDSKGAELAVQAKDGSPAILHGEAGSVYYLAMSAPANASNGGGCCEDRKVAATTLDVRLSKAPILFAGYSVGYIKGGAQTTGYKNVGVILLEGKVHCSGTVVGKVTVLTAAHCLEGYEAGKMSFILGDNYQFPYPDGGPIAVDTVDFPNGSNGPFKFNGKTYEDDIGVVYLKKAVSAKSAVLYNQAPTWDSIVATHKSLLFVGFGFNVVGGDLVGVGVKREGVWPIDSVTNRTILFSVPGKNTCHGDSGGPAFIETAQALLLAGVTSGGDDNCTHGVETRVDAYASWLNGRFR